MTGGGWGGARSLCSDTYGCQDSFLHLFHLCFHAVLEDRHEVDEVLHNDGSVKVFLRKARVFRGCPFIFQELAQVDGGGGFRHRSVTRARTRDGVMVSGVGWCKGGQRRGEANGPRGLFLVLGCP